MTAAPSTGLLGAVPPHILTMFSAVLRFPALVRAGFAFIPLMVIMVFAIVISVDFMLLVVVIAGARIESSSSQRHWGRHHHHGRQQNKGTEISEYSHAVLLS
jgi:hypothetical protein